MGNTNVSESYTPTVRAAGSPPTSLEYGPPASFATPTLTLTTSSRPTAVTQLLPLVPASHEHYSHLAACRAFDMGSHGNFFFEIPIIPLFAPLLAVHAPVIYLAWSVSTPAPPKPFALHAMVRASVVFQAQTAHTLVRRAQCPVELARFPK